MSDNIRDWAEDRWTEEWDQGFPAWTNMSHSAARLLVAAAQHMPQDSTEITEAQIGEWFIRPLHDTGVYYSNPDDDQRVCAWLLDLMEESTPQPEPSEPVNTTVDVDQVAAAIVPALPAITSAVRNEGACDQIMQVVRYQFNNWNRGVYKVRGAHHALQQFDRRMQREHGWNSSTHLAIRGQVSHLLDYLWLVAKGESPNMEAASLSSADLEYVIIEEGLSFSSSSGYLASALYRARRDIGVDGEVTLERLREPIKRHLLRYFETSFVEEHLTDGLMTSLHTLYMNLYLGAGIKAKPVEGVKDKESLIKWMLDLHPEAGSLQTDAIRDGLSDWFDSIRTEPDRVKSEGLVSAMRRQVKAYGFTRFSGKEPRGVLNVTLSSVFEECQGAGLTDEEWRERWARRDRAVSYVSGRYGEQNSMCSTLEAACKELGVEPLRKPKHKVRFRGSGVLVEVEVESWYDDQSSLSASARSAWSRMSDEQKEAAVVKREQVYVNWSDMQVAR